MDAAAEMSDAASPNDELNAAAEGLKLERMRAALDAGADDIRGAALLVVAVTTADLGRQGRPGVTATQLAEEQVAALRLLTSHGRLRASGHDSPLLYAVVHDCDPSVVRVLLESAGPSATRVFEWREKQCTLLHLVRRADTARLLLAAGARVDVFAFSGCMPLHGCSLFGGRAAAGVIRALVEAGADVNQLTRNGGTALDAAMLNTRLRNRDLLPVVSALLELGADPQAAPCARDYTVAYIREIVVTVVRRRIEHDDAGHLNYGKLISLLAPAAAWHRRRHMLLAIRSRYAASDAVTGAGAVDDAANSAGTDGCAAAVAHSSSM